MNNKDNENIEENVDLYETDATDVKEEVTRKGAKEKEQKDTKDAKALEELKLQLKQEKEKSDEYYDHLKRNMAEFDNFKKRIGKEKDMMYNSITANVISDLLPILDNFEKALNASTQDESYKDGMSMIYNQMIDAFKNLGVEEIEAINTTFDPNFHEAVMHVEDESFDEKQVVEVFRKGYKIGDKIIRHAMVKVAN